MNTVVPVSDICFAKHTPIETDQGIVLIQEMKPSVHTIRGEPIVAITRTKYVDDCLICLRHTLRRQTPLQYLDEKTFYCTRQPFSVRNVGPTIIDWSTLYKQLVDR